MTRLEQGPLYKLRLHRLGHSSLFCFEDVLLIKRKQFRIIKVNKVIRLVVRNAAASLVRISSSSFARSFVLSSA